MGCGTVTEDAIWHAKTARMTGKNEDGPGRCANTTVRDLTTSKEWLHE